MTPRVVILPGDGIGPEVAEAALACLKAAARFSNVTLDIEYCAFGGAAIDQHGDPLPEETLRACLQADAIFLGAVGGPRWDGAARRPEQGLLQLRQALGVFANLRPLRVQPGLEGFSPLREALVSGVDILIVRELTGGIYFGARTEGEAEASDLCAYTREEIERVARVAFEAARGRRKHLTSVDKANVLATSRLWRNTVSDLGARDFPDVALHHQLVDSMAMKLITGPREFDVVLTENMFGDILSDEASVIAGSIGLSPSASLGASGPGLYEPIHGSAPDIAGEDKANPVGAILSAAMLLRHSLGEEKAATALEAAVASALDQGLRTADLNGAVGCRAAAQAIINALEAV